MSGFFFETFILKNKIVGPVLEFFSEYQKSIFKFSNVIFILIIALVVFNVFSGMKMFDFETMLSSPKSADHLGSYFDVFITKVF